MVGLTLWSLDEAWWLCPAHAVLLLNVRFPETKRVPEGGMAAVYPGQASAD